MVQAHLDCRGCISRTFRAGLPEQHHAETTLGKVNLLPKAHFVLGRAVHMQFDGGSEEGRATSSFVVLDADGVEIVCAGQYYSAGHTNKESKSFALEDTLQYLAKLVQDRQALRCPIWVFGNS